MTESVSTSTRDRADARRRFAMAGGLVVLAVAIGIGMFAAARGFRQPFLDQKPNKLTDLLSQTIETKGIDAAVGQYRGLRERGFPGLHESESDTNSLGYKLLGNEDEASAIQVFQLNVETHPKPANVYDSLGEAYLAAGNKALAIENYQKAVAIAPKKKSAVSELQRLTNSKREPYRPMVLFHMGAALSRRADFVIWRAVGRMRPRRPGWGGRDSAKGAC